MSHRWLGLALYAEGSADHRFLDELLRRAVEHALLSGGHAVELSAMQRLVVPENLQGRAERIGGGAEQIQGAFHVLFVHADAGGDADRARVERVQPGVEEMRRRCAPGERRGVAVVPVRETEAWALADTERLCEVLGTTKTAQELGLPRSPADLEAVLDPKSLFEQVVRTARPGRRSRRRPRAATFLDLLGERTRVDQVARLPAFRAMLEELGEALHELGFRG